MKKVIRLTEQDLANVLKLALDKVFNPEQSDDDSDLESDVESDVESDTESLGNISAKGQKLLDNKTFKKKLKEISTEIGVGESSILKLMKHESGLDPSIKNSIGCVGLIQFCPDSGGGSSKTINGKTYNLKELQNNLELQMDAIKEFWSIGKRNGSIKTAKDLYIYNLFPIAAGKPDNFVLQANGLSAEKVAKANPIFNTTLGKPPGSPLTVGDLDDYYKKTGMV